MSKTYMEKIITLLKDSKDSNKGNEMPHLWVRILNFVKILMFLKLIYELNRIQSKSQE